MIVRLSNEAETDLERIADFIAQDNPRRARDFVRELRKSCFDLANFPRRFPVVERYAELGQESAQAQSVGLEEGGGRVT